MNLPDKWKAIYRPMTDEELIARAEKAGWVFIDGGPWGSFKENYGWAHGNSLTSVKKDGNRADPLRAEQSERGGRVSTNLRLEHILDCSFCGTAIDFHYMDNDKLLEAKMCFRCNHWHMVLNNSPRRYACEGDRGLSFYEAGDERGFKVKDRNQSFLGFAGAEVCLLKPTGEILDGNNLWHLGDIDDIYLPLVKNFAVLRWGTSEKIDETELSFLAEIRKAKPDPLPLLVYADWLDESGKPKTADAYRKLVAA